MTEYRCSQCKRTYTHEEYRSLDTTPRGTDYPDDEHGVETVCECGARFHSDRWHLIDEIDTDDGAITVSTVALTIPHGFDHDQWYETCLFHDHGSRVVQRYTTEDDATTGHEDIVEQVETGDYYFEPTGQRINLDHE